MASKTLLYSYGDEVVQINVELNSELPEKSVGAEKLLLDDVERQRVGLASGHNPWKHLGVPDHVSEQRQLRIAASAQPIDFSFPLPYSTATADDDAMAEIAEWIDEFQQGPGNNEFWNAEDSNQDGDANMTLDEETRNALLNMR